MLRTLVIAGLSAVAFYGGLGLLFTAAFHARGLTVIDPATRASGLGFRLLITPGIIALWPMLAAKWWCPGSAPQWLGSQERPVSPNAMRALHYLAWKLMAVLIPIAFVALLALRVPEPATQSESLVPFRASP